MSLYRREVYSHNFRTFPSSAVIGHGSQHPKVTVLFNQLRWHFLCAESISHLFCIATLTRSAPLLYMVTTLTRDISLSHCVLYVVFLQSMGLAFKARKSYDYIKEFSVYT